MSVFWKVKTTTFAVVAVKPSLKKPRKHFWSQVKFPDSWKWTISYFYFHSCICSVPAVKYFNQQPH